MFDTSDCVGRTKFIVYGVTWERRRFQPCTTYTVRRVRTVADKSSPSISSQVERDACFDVLKWS